MLGVNFMTVKIVLVKSATLMEKEREDDEGQMKSRIFRNLKLPPLQKVKKAVIKQKKIM